MDLGYSNEEPEPKEYTRRYRGLVHANDYPEDRSHGGIFATTAFLSILGRQLGIPHVGYFGLLPLQAGVGDRICLLERGDVPFIVRKCDKGYRYVGPAYVHGMMKGEGVEIAQRQAQQTKSLISSEK